MNVCDKDIQIRWGDLGKAAQGIIPTRLPIHPTGSDFLQVRKDLEVLARYVDMLIQSYGESLQASSTRAVDMDCFTNVLSNALTGEAFYEIDECAEEADQPEEDDPDRRLEEMRDRELMGM